MEITSKTTALLDRLKEYEMALNIFDIRDSKSIPEYAHASLEIGQTKFTINCKDKLYDIILNYLIDMVNKTKKEVKKELEKEIK